MEKGFLSPKGRGSGKGVKEKESLVMDDSVVGGSYTTLSGGSVTGAEDCGYVYHSPTKSAANQVEPIITDWTEDDGDVNLSTILSMDVPVQPIKNVTTMKKDNDDIKSTGENLVSATWLPEGSNVDEKRDMSKVTLRRPRAGRGKDTSTVQQGPCEVGNKNDIAANITQDTATGVESKSVSFGSMATCGTGHVVNKNVPVAIENMAASNHKSYASLLNNNVKKKRINFRTLINDESDDKADITLPNDSVEEVRHRFANTLFGFFLGKRLAFPIVENYVKNTWAKYGIMKVMLNDGFFFFKFASKTGMEHVLENGPWFIRTIPLILNTWTPTVTMKKDDITKIPVWVKLHKIPLDAYTETGLSLIGTKLGRPIMLDAYTSNMCLDSWGRTSYARALIEVSADQTPLKSLVVAIPLIDVPGYSYHIIEVEYEWQPPHCEACKVFGHSNDQCSKRVNQVNSSIDTNDGFIDANRKGGKGKQPAKTNPISGVRLTKPPPKFVYRAKAKKVDAKASTSTVNSRKSNMQRKSDDVGIASKVDNGKHGQGTTGMSSKVEEVKTKTSNSFDVLASLPEEEAFASSLNEKDTASNPSSSALHTSSSKGVENPKPSTAPASGASANKSGNPFSKVGDIVDSESDEDEVFELDNPMGSFFSSAGGDNDLEDYFSDDYEAHVFDLPGQFHDFKIQSRARKVQDYSPLPKNLELIGSNMTNAALQAILDGCRHLETLDLRRCVNIHLKGDLGKRCSEQIKYLKRPNDSPKGIPHIFKPCPYSSGELMELLYDKPGKFDRIMCRYPNYGDWNDRVEC